MCYILFRFNYHLTSKNLISLKISNLFCMKKKNLLLTCLLFLGINALFAQATIDKYCYLIFKGSIVKNTLHTYADFTHFDFTYEQLDDNTYILSGYAKNKHGDQLGNMISLDVYKGHTPGTLKNLEKGHLFLTLETMNENDVDGSEDYILSPKKCKDKDENTLDYVSYFFSNKAASTVELLSCTAVKVFTLNPSPPY